jgi:hypothetical protein
MGGAVRRSTHRPATDPGESSNSPYAQLVWFAWLSTAVIFRQAEVPDVSTGTDHLALSGPSARQLNLVTPATLPPDATYVMSGSRSGVSPEDSALLSTAHNIPEITQHNRPDTAHSAAEALPTDTLIIEKS